MKGKVLIVDDQTDVRTLLAMVLEKDYAVWHADSGAALQKAFGGEQPDVVLLDVKLPDADGLELLPQIKKRWAETEVIVLTGYGSFRWRWKRPSAAPPFLTKPFENEKLLVDVECAVERRQQSQENSTLRRALKP